MAPEPTESTPVATYPDRLTRLAEQAGVSGADVMLITPGPDLEYFIGHSVGSHERLTCLVVPATGEPALLVPTLERPGWSGTPVGVDWASRSAPGPTAQDPYPALADAAAGGRPGAGGGLPHARRARPERAGDRAGFRADAGRRGRSPSCGCARAPTRSRRWPPPGAAIDRVQRRIGEWLRPGRTENEVAADIAAAIVDEGHATAGLRHRRVRARTGPARTTRPPTG